MLSAVVSKFWLQGYTQQIKVCWSIPFKETRFFFYVQEFGFSNRNETAKHGSFFSFDAFQSNK